MYLLLVFFFNYFQKKYIKKFFIILIFFLINFLKKNNKIYKKIKIKNVNEKKNIFYSILCKKNNRENISIDKSYSELIKNKIIKILNHYKIKILKVKPIIGPTVTVYEIYPHIGFRISKIRNIENEIALNLYSESIRIIAPIPGKGTIGIEVPNNKKNTIYMDEILFSEESNEKSNKLELPITLGKTIFNKICIIDLTELPHLLISGSTGQGKSVGLNVIIISLLYRKEPKDVKFILIDPKKVELSIYKDLYKSYLATIPNNSNPIITNFNEVINILNSLCKEMDKRYYLLEKNKVRNIKEYNKIIHKKLPYIILIIDEFADLNLSEKKNKFIEKYIIRLSQLARAVGIHLIISTQRPSVDVISGLIKSNFTSRISFKVSSKIDSITILDRPGAEQLIGKGDLLFYNKNKLIRLQCPFISLFEIKKIIEFYNKYYKNNNLYLLPKYDKNSNF